MNNLFDESKHPRSPGGQFSNKDGRSSPGAPGQQMGLFSEDSQGQKMLFNVAPSKKSAAPVKRRFSEESLKAITAGLNAKHREYLKNKKTVSPADRLIRFQDESLEGQKELFSRLRAGLNRMLYEFDPAKHPREPSGSPRGGQFTRIAGPSSADLISRGVTATQIAPGRARVSNLVSAIEDWWQQHVSQDIAAPTGEDLVKGGLKITKGSSDNTVRMKGLTDSLNQYWKAAKAGQMTRFVDGILVDARGNPVTELGELLTGDHLREQQDREQGKQKLPFEEPEQQHQAESGSPRSAHKKKRVSRSINIDSARSRLEEHGYQMGDPETKLHDGMFHTEYQVTDPDGKSIRASAKGLQRLINDLANRNRSSVEPDPRKQLSHAEKPLEKIHKTKSGGLTGAAQIHVNDLKVDPKRFQYKISGIGNDGVTDELKGVKQFNPSLGGQLLVWRDPNDGQNYVINGHHRYELASRSLGQGDWDGNLSVYFLDSKTPQEARAQGALANIAEGRGTAIDAAKFLRDSGLTPDEMSDKYGVSLKGTVARDGAALTKLSDYLFQKLSQEEVSQGRALAIANNLPDHQKQGDLMQLIRKHESKTGKELSDAAISEMAKMLHVTPVKKSAQGGLFGGMEQPLIAERGQLVAGLRRSLTGEKNVFKQASTSRRASVLESAGDNKLDIEANKGAAKSAEVALWDFDKRVNSSGDPLAKAVSHASEQWSEAKSQKQRRSIEKELERSVRKLLQAHRRTEEERHGKPEESDRPGGRPARDGMNEPYSRMGRFDRFSLRDEINKMFDACVKSSILS